MIEVDLHRGDCLEILPMLEAGSVDAVITDPPYFVPVQHYSTRTRYRRSFADLSLLESFFRNWFAEVERVLSATGVLYIFCNGQSYPLFFAYSYPFVKGVRPLIWDKVVAYNGYSWRHQHELILFAEMPGATVVKTGDGDILRYRAVKAADRIHPAQKPVDLVARLIAKSTEPDDVVLDPFMGSGTTGIVCAETGRNFIGIEIDSGYFAGAKERIGSVQYGDRREVPQLSLLDIEE